MKKSPTLFLTLFTIICITPHLFAASPVDRTQKLMTVSTDFKLADGPAWDGSWLLYVPDVKGEKLFRHIPKKNVTQVLLPQAGFISASYYSHGKLYLSENKECRISKLEGKKLVPIVSWDKTVKRSKRPNDLVVDIQGGVYVTLTGQGEVVYITPEGKEKVAVKEIKTPNGIILSPDGKTLYVSAYVPKEIWVYDVKSGGEVSEGKLFAKMDDGKDKGADGMSIDRAGNVYCTGPKHIWIWSPSGKLLDKIETPTRPINCTFGGQQMQTLYITGFGGLYKQQMKTKGCSPHLPTTANIQPQRKNRPSTIVPKNITAHLNVVYATYGDRKMLADIFVPQGKTKPMPTIVVVHGGGWLNGDKTKFRALAVELAKRGYVTCAIEYRLAGEALFPAGIQDCNASVRFLRAHAKQYQIDVNRIGAVGGSAGGHLVGLMATASHEPKLQGQGGNGDYSSKLQAAIVMAGPMKMVTGSVAERSRTKPKGSNANIWLGKTIDQDRDLYKLADAHLHISKNSSPILFMMGEFDRPERNADSRKKLKEAGVATGVKSYPKGKHGCWNQLPWFDDMVKDMDMFFQRHLQ